MTVLSFTVLAAAIDPAGAFSTEIAPLLDLGISGVLLALIVWFLRGYIRQVGSGEWVPRRELDYVRADRESRLADKDGEIERERQISAEYRAALETSERARELLAQQVRDAVDALRTPSRFFDAFRAHVIEGRELDGGFGDAPDR